MINQLSDIQKLQESIFVKKEEGTEVHYFLYPEFEVHRNLLPSGTVQNWHAHKKVEEVIVGIQGQFSVEVVEGQNVSTISVEMGDVVRVNNSIHRLTNKHTESAEFIVFRFVKENKDQSEVIKQDKIEYTSSQIKDLLKGDDYNE